MDCDYLQDDLRTFSHWCNVNILKLKCYKITLSNSGKKCNSAYKLCGIDYPEYEQRGDLGVLLNKKFVFNAHINGIISHSLKMLELVQRNS